MVPHGLWLLALLAGAVPAGRAQEPEWGMQMPTAMTGLKGSDVVLPCNFTHPNKNYMGIIRVIWESHFFQCWVANNSDTNGNCSKEPGPNSRYSLAGDPRQHDLSLRVARLNFEDKGLYSCRVELVNKSGQCWTHPTSLNLTVEASPSILNLSLLEGPGPARAFCMAEGNPLPNITWWGPGNTSESPSPRETQVNFQSAAEITLRRNGTYTCRAKNTRGCAELSLTVGPSKNTRFLLLAALLPTALLLLALLVLALVLCQRRKGRCQGSQRDCVAHASPASNMPHADTCTYAELSTTRVTGTRTPPKSQVWLPPTPKEEVTYADLAL